MKLDPLPADLSGYAAKTEEVRLEIAVDHPEAALAAIAGGAQRLELCASLADGGLTPSLGFVASVLAASTIPAHCLLRPRAGNFVYSSAEIDVMVRDIELFKREGAHGIVTGALTAGGHVDAPALLTLVTAARPMRVCFHRAFDLGADRERALEDLIACGAELLLTSGGAVSLADGAEEIRRIAAQAAGRIEIVGAAGVRVENAGALWRSLPVDTLHASLRGPWPAGGLASGQTARMGSRDDTELHTVRAEDVRSVLAQLKAAEAAHKGGSSLM